MIRLFVFDLDGTLVDSRRDLADAANALLGESGARPIAEEAIGRMVGEGAATLVARAFAAAGLPQPEGALDRFLALYDARLLCHTRPYPGIRDMLQALQGRGAAMAVLTNKPLAATRRVLAGLELAEYFPDDRVVGGDGPLPRKPDPTALRVLAAAAGVPLTETILVGDSAIDWRTARNAGTSSCLVRYGFGFDSVPQSELTAEDTVVDEPAGLLIL